MAKAASGFRVTMRVVVLASAAYFAYVASILGGRWWASGGLLAPFLTVASLVAFLLLPPRALARPGWLAILMASPFPVFWVATLAEEGVREAAVDRILLLHVPLIIQAGLVLYHRSALRDAEWRSRRRRRSAPHLAARDGAAHCS